MKKRVYMDHAATTYLATRVKKTMEEFWIDKFGNPSSIYKEGRAAKAAISSARAKIAKIIGAKPEEIIFTSGGTESDNLAIFGVVFNIIAHVGNPVFSIPAIEGKDSKNRIPDARPFHILTTKFEHHAVLNPCKFLEKHGFDVTYLDVGENGIVNPEDVRKTLRKNTILVSIMYANNEIGTIQPISEIAEIIRNFRKTHLEARLLSGLRSKASKYPLFHIDACQAGEYLNLNVNKLCVDLMTINGSKIYGPKGIGLLYVRSGVKLRPMLYGGEQENKTRPGTENVPAIAGLAEALEIAQENRNKEMKRLVPLRDYFIKRLTTEIPKTFLNGHLKKRLPNNINVSILGVEGESVVLHLDELGVACSTGSACTSESLEPSHVIMALGRSHEYGHGSLRFTLGRANTKKDIDYVMKILPKIVKKLRNISAINI